ncbi:UNVERIFIED_CONTAM: hypothetical protein FKN15_061335 [Acipenser sinensis]
MAISMETQLQSIFEEVVKTEIIEEAFAGLFMDTPEDERTKLISCLGAFRQYWSTLPQESHDQCVQWIVRFIHGQHSPKRISFLYDCLAMAVETGLLPPRMVCEALINSDNLEWERTQLWALTFRLIRKIIGGVDYKGVRDLLKALLEKIQSIPNTVSSAVVQQLLAAREVIEYILDRNACLLPAYFAITEIRKLYPEGKLSHWLLGNLISDFVDSFRATARINSICGRCSLLPVVNNSGAICNSWKLDPTTLRFPLRGLLPYDKDLFEPQTGLLRYVLEQPYSRDMVCNMLGLNKQHKQRCPVLEDQLVDLVVYAMERSETEEQFDDGGTSQLLWQHLSSQLIFFVLFQFASFPHMVLSLHQKCIPVPDINKPQSTHAFAMTCIWIHLNRKAQNDNSKLQIPIPHSLKLHHEFLQQSLRNKSLQMTDYKIALLCNAYSTNSECFTLPMGVLVETIHGNGNIRIPLPGTNCMASGSISPLPMSLLDSLTVHAKMSVESTALRLITALGNSEVQPQFTRFLSDPKTVLSAESEELNRALILTLARATHVTDFFTGSDSIQGTWCKDILQTIMTFTPHNWASHTLSCFPAPLQAFFRQNNVPQESRFNLKKNVEEEYRKWKSMTIENDIITHFSMQGSPPLFLCLLWKMLLETDHINQSGYRVLKRIGARALVAHVRTFADFLVYEFSTSAGGQQLNKCIEILNDMVWKYNIVTLDRLILCLAMRSHEGNEAQVCYFIIQLLLLKPNDFRNRVSDFVKENFPEHWMQNDWHTKHMNYHKLLPNVFKSHAWGILHTLLEMFSYRMHHIQPHYRVQLLSHLHSLAAVPQTNQNQLHLCVESTALRLITALGNSEVQPQFTRFLSDPKTVLSAESEELNRALILTLARATHVTDFFTGSDSIQGTWCKDILQTIMTFTPHNWASHTLSCFPAPLQAFFRQNNVPQESRFNLKKNVEEEYRKWKSMTIENDIITHFSMQGSPPLFLCLLWKMLLETDHINQSGYRVLKRIGARALVAHVRTFADFLVYEFSTSAGGQQLNKCIEILNDMVWKYNIVTLDRLILCLAMRSHEGNEAQVCYFIIQLLLLKPNDFRNRVSDFVKENFPEHWMQNDWHTKHMNYHKKYPEKLYFEGLAEQVSPPVQIQPHHLPIYFGNVCLRFLPVFDIVIHRFLELLPVSKSLETLLDHLGGLYKFHDRPVTYLYNTLHYYEKHLRDRTNLKRKLVHAIISSLKENRTQGWCLSETYLKCAMNAREDNPWIPDDTYYCKLIGRLVDNILSL